MLRGFYQNVLRAERVKSPACCLAKCSFASSKSASEPGYSLQSDSCHIADARAPYETGVSVSDGFLRTISSRAISDKDR